MRDFSPSTPHLPFLTLRVQTRACGLFAFFLLLSTAAVRNEGLFNSNVNIKWQSC
jgi:hypothetical protein